MSEINVRVLGEDDWAEYREVRLLALQESPESFIASYEDEVAEDEQFWRDRMNRSDRFLAERDDQALGIVSLGVHSEEEQIGDVFGLYVAPEGRNTGVSWNLVKAAATKAAEKGYVQLYYWAGSENGRAIAFAVNFGFRPTGDRRPTRVENNEEFGQEEVAMVLSLQSDPGATPNPTSFKPTGSSGPNR